MTALDKIVTMTLRVLQLVGAAIVIGLASKYIATDGEDTEFRVRFIVTDIVAAISAFFSFIWLLPFSSNHMNYWVDGVIGIGFAGVSAWLVYMTQKVCGKARLADFERIKAAAHDGASFCDKWKALYVFSLICTVLWLSTALIGCFWVKKNTFKPKAMRKNRRR
ncbi:integral membrane protein [Thelonectria olida]|uniref:Integral membrane protein n=1 Tax=Thelonectria olida TaxID=1576542 RepID=A0A9P8VSK4_9HYPO|nr:integral membrane protein [Thelonectria olida]